MKLQLFKPLWGHVGSFGDAADQAADAGFDGLEGPLPVPPEQRREFIEHLCERGLHYIAEISTTGYATPTPGSTVGDHLEAFELILVRSLEAQPIFCTTMAGSDLWSFAESVEFFTKAQAMAERYAVRVGFETHRSRSFFHPIVTRNLLRELPPIELTIDFSHWCVVTERLVLDELPEILALCAERVLHLHGRIGYDQGAQVPDPRAPEYAEPVRAHFAWWRALWAGQLRRSFETVTMTPEFGPDGYLHCEPFTQKPVADLWEINAWVGGKLRRAFEDFVRV